MNLKIYSITNKINNKKYIGVTIDTQTKNSKEITMFLGLLLSRSKF